MRTEIKDQGVKMGGEQLKSLPCSFFPLCSNFKLVWKISEHSRNLEHYHRTLSFGDLCLLVWRWEQGQIVSGICPAAINLVNISRPYLQEVGWWCDTSSWDQGKLFKTTPAREQYLSADFNSVLLTAAIQHDFQEDNIRINSFYKWY